MNTRQPARHERFARLVLFVLLAAAGFTGALAAAPALGWQTTAGAPVEIHARMPENGGWSVETLQIEAGRPLRLRLTSDDVLHSFAIGQSGEDPIDLEPGKWHETTLVFDKPGRYTFYCTRWCGRNHWRMRGTILVNGSGASTDSSNSSTGAEKPLYARLGLNLDAPRPAAALPPVTPSAARGAALGAALEQRLPAWALERQTYLETSPAGFYERLRAEPSLDDLTETALWDVVAFAWSRQTTPAALAGARARFATNCAACHGETGAGDGVMVEGLPRFDPALAHETALNETQAGSQSGDAHAEGALNPSSMGLSAPPDFTDPRVLFGASPALLEGKMLRGGMGTGMPYWGPIFTPEETAALIAYLYTFAHER